MQQDRTQHNAAQRCCQTAQQVSAPAGCLGALSSSQHNMRQPCQLLKGFTCGPVAEKKCAAHYHAPDSPACVPLPCVAWRPLRCRRPQQQRPQMTTRQPSTGQHLNFIPPWTQRWSPSREQQLEQQGVQGVVVVEVLLFRGSSGCVQYQLQFCCSFGGSRFSCEGLPLSLATWAREGRLVGWIAGCGLHQAGKRLCNNSSVIGQTAAKQHDGCE